MLAKDMILNALDQAMKPEWVLGDSVYGESSDLRRALQERNQPYVLGITGKHYVWMGFEQFRVSDIIKSAIEKEEWRTLSLGAGTRGERLYQWVQLSINGSINGIEPENWRHHLLLRKPLNSNKA